MMISDIIPMSNKLFDNRNKPTNRNQIENK
jgi:hypothetical protein